MTRALVCVWMIAGCATGTSTNGNGPQDASPQHDGQHVAADAAVKHDAGMTSHDAFVPHDAPAQTTDAASARFCTMNSQCTNAGECCLIIGGAGLCSPGTIVLGTCLPIQ